MENDEVDKIQMIELAQYVVVGIVSLTVVFLIVRRFYHYTHQDDLGKSRNITLGETDSNLWARYPKMGSSNAALQKKASLLCPLLIKIIQDVTSRLLKYADEMHYASDKKVSNAIFIETFLLYLFMCDRLSFEEFGPEKRSIFVDVLTLEFLKTLKIGAEVTSKIYEHYDLRASQYTQYKKLFAETNEPLRDTLFWEYAKIISEIVAKGKFSDILIPASTEASLGILHLDIRDLIQK